MINNAKQKVQASRSCELKFQVKILKKFSHAPIRKVSRSELVRCKVKLAIKLCNSNVFETATDFENQSANPQNVRDLPPPCEIDSFHRRRDDLSRLASRRFSSELRPCLRSYFYFDDELLAATAKLARLYIRPVSFRSKSVMFPMRRCRESISMTHRSSCLVILTATAARADTWIKLFAICRSVVQNLGEVSIAESIAE